MGKISLFEHNEKAYKKLCEALKDNKCATINHATGTGKSFIALKYLHENKDKKYLYLAPTYPIIEQLLSSCYKIGITPEDINIDTMIYRNLLKMDMDEIYEKYDGFIFDEYHRTGATETYKKIKELKLKLQENNDGKKFIGLTATPIRYLDRNRNMTKEIFDDVVASRISLSEAMLDELLPVPLYINSKIACKEQYEQIRIKIDRLAPTKEKQELEKKIEAIGKQINNGALDKKEMVNKYIKGQKGKYIIFCNTKDELGKYYDEVDKWFEEFGEIKKYKVYSNQTDDTKKEQKEEGKQERTKQRTSKEVNQSNIDQFNNEKDGISVLFSVDILNEGIHVDDIDGVMLLRKTTSPIIYFQQIGRALSFSGRNKQIQIFDLVNNFGRHSAIDELFEEFQEEARRKIELDPGNKEKYESILEKFKIMDETREILNGLEEISTEVTPEKIIESKLNYAIDIISKSDQRGLKVIDNEETKKGYMWIAKYYKYVDNEQFRKLIDLDIVLPDELTMSYEERIEQLKGYNSIHEKEIAMSKVCIEEAIEFITINGRKANIESTNKEEIALAQKYLESITELNDELREKLISVIDENEIPLESWEKVFLNKEILGQDIDNLVILANNYLQQGNILPKYLYEAINNITFQYNTSKNQELFKILEDSDSIEQARRKLYEEQRLSKIANILEYIEQNIELGDKGLIESEVTKEASELSVRDKKYIVSRYERLKKDTYRKVIKSEESTEMGIFCRRMKGIKNKEIQEYSERIEQDKEMYATLKGIIEFMAKNEGRLPSKDSEDELEQKLAIRLEQYKERGNIREDFQEVGQDFGSVWYSSEQIMYDVILENFKQSDIKSTIIKYVQFFNKTGRKALKNSLNEEEKKLAIEYEQRCIANMEAEHIDSLNKIFNNRRSLQMNCAAYIKNIKASQEER